MEISYQNDKKLVFLKYFIRIDQETGIGKTVFIAKTKEKKI